MLVFNIDSDAFTLVSYLSCGIETVILGLEVVNIYELLVMMDELLIKPTFTDVLMTADLDNILSFLETLLSSVVLGVRTERCVEIV